MDGQAYETLGGSIQSLICYHVENSCNCYGTKKQTENTNTVYTIQLSNKL